jgi:MoxR-like ATPase
VLEHRLVLGPDADLRGTTQADVVREVLDGVPVPRAGG